MRDSELGQIRERLLALIQERAYTEGSFALSSGEQSDFYVNIKNIELSPEGAYLIGEMLYAHTEGIEFDALGGLAVGAVPMIASFERSCYDHQRPIEGFFVRVERKEHGTKQLIEGKLVDNARVIIVDDVVTSGRSVMDAVKAVEQHGGTVVLILSVVDREAGAKEHFKDAGYKFQSLFTKSDILQFADSQSTEVGS